MMSMDDFVFMSDAETVEVVCGNVRIDSFKEAELWLM